jgi:hypothetical protein
VINAGSVAGRTLVPQMTALENIRLAARVHGVDETMLIALVESSCRFGERLSAPIQTFDREMRRRLEATLIAAIPFDCYYIDRMHEFDGRLIWQFVHVAARRGSGIFFSSRIPKQVGRFAEMRLVVKDRALELQRHPTRAVLDDAV